MLSKPFDFFGFSLKLNQDQQIDIANRALIRYYKMKVSQLCEEKEGIQAEMEAMRRLMQTFKSAAENAERKI